MFTGSPVQKAGEPHARRRWQDYNLIKEEVIKILRDHDEGMTGAKIAELVGITQGAMSKYLSMLKVDGIITSRKVGVAKLWKLVSQSDRAGMLADRIDEATFKDYAVSLLEEDGKLYEADGKRIIVMPTMVLSNLYKYTKSIVGTQVHAFFYEWGRDYVREVSRFVDEVAKKTGTDFIHAFLLLWKLKGWGRFEVTAMSEKHSEVIWHDPIWAGEVDDAKSAADDFVAGALAEAASHMTGSSWRFVESRCRNMGAQQCVFIGSVLK
jgi:predicted hydrocarbon binding protein